MNFFKISQKCSSSNRNFEFCILEHSETSLHQISGANAVNVFFLRASAGLTEAIRLIGT